MSKFVLIKTNRFQHPQENYEPTDAAVQNAGTIRQKLEQFFNVSTFEEPTKGFAVLGGIDELIEVNESCGKESTENDPMNIESAACRFETSNGPLTSKDLENHVVQCENDLETLSFRLILNNQDDEKIRSLEEHLAVLAETVGGWNEKFKAESRPLIPFDTGSVNEMKEHWYHLHKDSEDLV